MSEHSTMVSTGAAARLTVATSPSFSDETTSDGFSITESMVSYLRTEADEAEEKAKRLRKQAAAIAEQFGVTEQSQQAYGLDPKELPPLDEKGLPKYKGRKRGRKPKAKKRKTKPDGPKRKHTGYTLFMQEVYPVVKSEYPNLPSKELIRLVAGRWKDLDIGGRTAWKERASRCIDGPKAVDDGRNNGVIETAPLYSKDSYPILNDGGNRETEDKEGDDMGVISGVVSKTSPEEKGEEDVGGADTDRESIEN